MCDCDLQDFSLQRPTRAVAEALARVIVAANDKLGEDTEPRVRALAGMPKA